jgi:hypothetical protein
MVRAILEGRKTMTRRVVKKQPVSGFDETFYRNGMIKCPHGTPGDCLWVRETWAKALWSDSCLPLERYLPGSKYQGALYAATPHPDYHNKGLWKPSIFMPRWASRITLEIGCIRVERLQEITEEDAKAEGISEGPALFYKGPTKVWPNRREAFRDLWDTLNAKRGYGWGVNPWVWVISFTRREVMK